MASNYENLCLQKSINQAIFLERIRRAGGAAFMAQDCRDVQRELGRD